MINNHGAFFQAIKVNSWDVRLMELVLNRLDRMVASYMSSTRWLLEFEVILVKAISNHV